MQRTQSIYFQKTAERTIYSTNVITKTKQKKKHCFPIPERVPIPENKLH